MLARAWEDGKITKDEQHLLSEVVEFLSMHPDRVRRLSDEARKSMKAPPPEEGGGWMDGMIFYGKRK